MTLVCPLAMSWVAVTGLHEPLPKYSETSRTKTLLLAGQVISKSLAEINATVSEGGSTWNEAVLVTFPCGVTMVIGPEVASGGTSRARHAGLRRDLLHSFPAKKTEVTVLNAAARSSCL